MRTIRLDVRMNRALVMTAALTAVAAMGWGAPAVQAAPIAAGSSGTAPYTKIAGEVNLTGRDLPGWKQTPNSPSPSDQANSDRLASCAGAVPPSKADIINAYSPYFDQGNTEVSSSVAFVTSRAVGATDLKAMSGPKLVSCLTKLLLPYLHQQLPAGTKVTRFQMTAFHPSWSPPRSFGYRAFLGLSIVTKAGAAPVKATLDLDVIGFLVGRAEVELSATDQGAVPDQRLEQRLASELVGRADKYASRT